MQRANARHDDLAKPRRSLGRVEEVGARLAAIARACPPPVPQQPTVVIFAADHGVLAHGVSPWPQQVTATMIDAFCAGKAAANVIAETVGAQVVVVDVGVASDLPRHPRLRNAKVRAGTDDLSQGPALTREDAARALLVGADLVGELQRDGADLLIGGDMGIGDTTPAACLIAAFTSRPARDVTGRGTGIDDATHEHKIGIVKRALALHRPGPLGVLTTLGGPNNAPPRPREACAQATRRRRNSRPVATPKGRCTLSPATDGRGRGCAHRAGERSSSACRQPTAM